MPPLGGVTIGGPVPIGVGIGGVTRRGAAGLHRSARVVSRVEAHSREPGKVPPPELETNIYLILRELAQHGRLRVG